MDKDEKEEQRITYEVMHKGQMKSTNVCTISVPDGRTNWIDARDLSKKRTICQRNEQTNVQAYRMGGQTVLMHVICQRYEQTYVQSYRMGG